MHAQFFVGLLFSFAAAYVLTGAFFVQAWRHRRREGEHLLFGLLTFVLSIYGVGVGLAYWHASAPHSTLPFRLLVDLAVSSAIVALALVIHFALRYAESPRERTIMRVLYPAAAFFLAVVLSDNWWSSVPEQFPEMVFLGLTLPRIELNVTPVALVFHLAAPIGVAFVAALLGRAYRRGRREGLAAFAGSLVLTVTTFNDALALGAGLTETIAVLPFGYMAFTYGVSLTLVNRYGRIATKLEQRTEELRHRSDELAKSVMQLKHTQAELVRSEQLAVIGELAAVIAHEVRNPLAIVGNALASLRKGGTSETNRSQLLAIIEEEMERLDTMVGHLLNYARPVVVQRSELDVGELIERTLAVVDDRSRVEKPVVFPDDSPHIAGDANLLRQAFENVVANAFQAMGDQGALTVRIAKQDVQGVPSVIVDFSDTGEGMTAAQCKQALAPFFTTRPTGTGLGLPICDRIVEAHGGTIEIQSEVGVGTTVSVTLPQQASARLTPKRTGRRISMLP